MQNSRIDPSDVDEEFKDDKVAPSVDVSVTVIQCLLVGVGGVDAGAQHGDVALGRSERGVVVRGVVQFASIYVRYYSHEVVTLHQDGVRGRGVGAVVHNKHLIAEPRHGHLGPDGVSAAVLAGNHRHCLATDLVIISYTYFITDMCQVWRKNVSPLY